MASLLLGQNERFVVPDNALSENRPDVGVTPQTLWHNASCIFQLFIMPLVVNFVLVYLSTISKGLTRFLRERAAAVKFAMGLVFIALGGWLLISLLL